MTLSGFLITYQPMPEVILLSEKEKKDNTATKISIHVVCNFFGSRQ